jgi:hypothetical protein
MINGLPVLYFEPKEELVFRDKLGHTHGEPLIIKNKNLEEIYFKVKSTASKFYSVRPSYGTIKPHGHIKVIIQPHDDSLKSLDIIEENNHRFMIQCAYFDIKCPKTADDFWQTLDKNKVPVTTAKLYVRVKRPDSFSSTEALDCEASEHCQGLVDQAEAFALAHFHVRSKENVKDDINVKPLVDVKTEDVSVAENKQEVVGTDVEEKSLVEEKNHDTEEFSSIINAFSSSFNTYSSSFNAFTATLINKHNEELKMKDKEIDELKKRIAYLESGYDDLVETVKAKKYK